MNKQVGRIVKNRLEKEYHNIYDNVKLASLIDSNNEINCDICIRQSDSKDKVISLKNVKTINGNLSIDSNDLRDLGELELINGNFWLSNCENLRSLNSLIEINGDANLRYSSIECLGKLTNILGKLSLRDTNIVNLSNLKYVAGDLFLPKRLENISLSNIVIKGKVKYWNDKDTSNLSILNRNQEWGQLNNLLFSEIHCLELTNKKRYITGEFLVKKCFNPSELNNYITENSNDFFQFIDKKLDELYGDKYSFFHSIFSEIKSVKELNREFTNYLIDKRKQIDYNETNKKVNEIINTSKSNIPFNKYFSILNQFKIKFHFSGYTAKYLLRYNEHKLTFCESTGTDNNSFIYFIENTILSMFSIFVISNQNEFRISKGLPKIGEGWISETELYQKLKIHFNAYKVQQHGKTKWLAKQHIDIWFPQFKIGVEFQGKQHFEPIEYFGGIETYIKNQDRDLRKKGLFKENNAILIEVTHGYDFEKLIIEIEELIIANKN
ncbi:MAG: hypothetical protein Q7T92_10915 [Lutibacter sp.]|nr:hypothetical protein [Lutibacter sp.]